MKFIVDNGPVTQKKKDVWAQHRMMSSRLSNCQEQDLGAVKDSTGEKY